MAGLVKFPAGRLTDPVSVRPYTGETAYGPSYGPVASTLCQFDATRRLVRGAAGDEVVSEVTLFLSPDLDPALNLEQMFAPESLVTSRGRDAQVISAKPHLRRGVTVYLEVTLT